MKKEKLGFFGGSFNPPTNIHIALANDLIEDGILDKVIFVPVGDYYKKDSLVSAKHRYNMLKLATSDYKEIDVEDIAIIHNEKLYATDTFKLIYDKYSKEFDLYFIMGADNFEKMPTWKNFAELIKKYKFIVIERPQYLLNDAKLSNIIYYRTKQKEDMSSTKIRGMLKQNKDIKQWINKETLQYIQKNNLYK